MEKRTELAFQYADASTKQLITLSTAIIAFTVTFSKDFVGGTPPNLRVFVTLSWVFFMVSIICGQWTLLAMTGLLATGDRSLPLNVFRMSIKLPATLQILFFILAIGLQTYFAVKLLT